MYLVLEPGHTCIIETRDFASTAWWAMSNNPYVVQEFNFLVRKRAFCTLIFKTVAYLCVCLIGISRYF